MPTYAEIQAEIEKLKVEAEKARRDNMPAAIEEILALMKSHGVTVDDLKNASLKGSQSGPSNAKYRDPETSDTWSGRGKPPAWFKKRIEAGQSKESLLIKP